MKKLLAILSIALFSSASAYAENPQLVTSTPADGSSATPPSAFVLEFSKPVQLHALYIKTNGGGETRLGHLPSTHGTTLTVPAPALTPGQYILEWNVFTDDSMALSGRIRFTVSAPSSPH